MLLSYKNEGRGRSMKAEGKAGWVLIDQQHPDWACHWGKPERAPPGSLNGCSFCLFVCLYRTYVRHSETRQMLEHRWGEPEQGAMVGNWVLQLHLKHLFGPIGIACSLPWCANTFLYLNVCLASFQEMISPGRWTCRVVCSVPGSWKPCGDAGELKPYKCVIWYHS